MAVAVIFAAVFVFSVEYRKAQYASYARQLYYNGMLYAATCAGDPYDGDDGEFRYITDAGRLGEGFPYGGRISIAFDEAGEIKFAQWDKDGGRDFIDQFVTLPARYPPDT